MTDQPSLSEEPVEQIDGEPIIVWDNGHMRLNLIHTEVGLRPAITRCDGQPLNGSGILAFDGQRVLLVRQSRHPAGVQTWEMPLGGMDADESPAAAAARELSEETGVVICADHLIPLGTIRPNSSRLTGANWLFLVGVDAATDAEADMNEVSDAAWFPVDVVVSACVDGTITCPSTVSAVLRARIMGLI